MHTDLLKTKYRQEYADFYSANQVVFSMPCVMNITGNSQAFHSVHIKQKLPLRISIGLNKSKTPGVHLKSFSAYSHNKELFYSRKIPDYVPMLGRYLEVIEETYPSSSGVEVNILSEVGRHIGLGVTPIILFALFCARRWIDDPQIYEKLSHLSEVSISESIGRKSFFGKLLRDYMYIANAIYFPHEAFSIATSFVDGAYPLVFLGKDFEKYGTRTHLHAFSLRDFLDKGAQEYPYTIFDTSILYSGVPIQSENGIMSNTNNDALQEVKSLLFDTWDMLKKSPTKTVIPTYITQIGSKNQTLSKNALEPYQSLLVLRDLINLYNNAQNTDMRITCLQTLDRCMAEHIYLYGIDESMYRAYHDISDAFHEKPLLPAVTVNDLAALGGSFVITSPVGFHQDIVQRLPQTLRKEHTECALVYCSWKDGHEQHGIKLEQDINRKLLGDFTDRNIGFLTYQNTNLVLTRQKLLEESRNKILFDIGAERVYCHGRAMNSKELPSQKATIEVIAALMGHPNHTIKNSKLTKSIYSGSKNEMQGKILGPLNKISLAYLGTRFPMELVGGQNDFEIILRLEKNSNVGIFRETLN